MLCHDIPWRWPREPKTFPSCGVVETRVERAKATLLVAGSDLERGRELDRVVPAQRVRLGQPAGTLDEHLGDLHRIVARPRRVQLRHGSAKIRGREDAGPTRLSQ